MAVGDIIHVEKPEGRWRGEYPEQMRWLRRADGTQTLQQRWRIVEMRDGHILYQPATYEWRDVPVVMED